MSAPILNRLALVALLTLAVVAPASAEWRDVSYADMVKMPLTLKKVDPEKIFSTTFYAKPGDGHTALPADFRLQAVAKGQIVAVPIQADGRIDLPVRQDWLDSGTVLQTNVPKGRVKVDMTIKTRTPAGTRMSYAQLTESAPVMERGIKEMAGMMSFLAPKVRELVLRFDQGSPQTVTLTLPGGKQKSWKTDAKGHTRLPWEPKWLDATVELSAPLQGIDQVLK